MNVDWGSAVTTVLTGAVTAFILWMAPRLFPVARWSKDLERDLGLLDKMPDGAAKDVFRYEIDLQVNRITHYRESNTGGNRVIRTVLISFCATWYVVMAALVIDSAGGTGSPWDVLASVPILLWGAGLVALGAIIWILTGANDGRLVRSSKAPPRPVALGGSVITLPPKSTTPPPSMLSNPIAMIGLAVAAFGLLIIRKPAAQDIVEAD